LEVLVQHHNGLVQFFLQRDQLCPYVNLVCLGETDNIDNDAREQLALLMLVWTLLQKCLVRVDDNTHRRLSYHDCELEVLLVARVQVVGGEDQSS
jgi:hypothetical protein